MEDYQWIEGAVAVEAVLRAQSREMAELLISRERFDGRVARLQQLARELGVAVSRVSAATIGEHVPGEAHGGVIAKVGARRMSALDDLFVPAAPVIFVLDGVEDPHNFGQAVRSMYAAGIDGLVVPTRNWLSAAGTVVRASAGALWKIRLEQGPALAQLEAPAEHPLWALDMGGRGKAARPSAVPWRIFSRSGGRFA